MTVAIQEIRCDNYERCGRKFQTLDGPIEPIAVHFGWWIASEILCPDCADQADYATD
jgi:hypothetical protein